MVSSRKLPLIAVASLAALAIVGLTVVKTAQTNKKNAQTKQATQVTGQIQEQAGADVNAKNYDAAIASLQAAIKNSQNPKDQYNLRLQLGAAYMQKGDYEGARQTFRQAHASSPVQFGDALGLATADTNIYFAAIKHDSDTKPATPTANQADRDEALNFYKQALALTDDKTQQAAINAQIQTLNSIK